MAAAPAEAPTSLAAPALPPAKTEKDPSSLEASLAVPGTATADWPSLPHDIVRRIADSFLATNDLDWYMDLRAVCHNWRSATDDPKDSTSDPRFRPHRWIILDEVFQSDTRRLLVNTATGRFLHKELPLLRDYYVVTTTPRGFFVLADRSPPHAASVFNPLTGTMICFTAPAPPEGEVFASVYFGGSCPMLTLLCGSGFKHYTAFPQSFATIDSSGDHGYFRRSLGGGFGVRSVAMTKTLDVLGKIRDVAMLILVDHLTFFSCDPPEMGLANDARCFLIDFGGHVLIIVKRRRLIHVLEFKADSGALLRVQSIMNHAIFIGHRRCLAVDADVFPSVEANCIYYTEHQGSSAHIWKYNIKDRKAERISEAVDFVKQDKQFVLVGERPFTIIQLLSSYTISTRDSELAGAVKLDD